MRMRLPALLLMTAVLGGCATKRDLRDLRVEVDSLRVSQEAMLRQIQEQNAAILDSIGSQGVRLRGDLGNQLLQMERQLVQIQELTGQGQQQLREVRERIETRGETPGAGGETLSPGAAGSADELYETSLAALRRGSLSTARAGFQEFLSQHPRHPQAAEAQFFIGESYAEGGEPGRALEAYGRVLELYPTSTRAPTALYRAGMIELERGNRDQARNFFNQVVTAYPRSPEVALAREQLQRIGRN